MHRGIQVAIAMWAMTALSLILAGLRVYTRLRIVRFFGVEDHLFVWTGIFLLLFAGSLQVAVYYGLGQSLWILSLDNSSNAILWTYIANTFAIIGNALAKLSMGFFLLRVVQLRGQKITIWILIAITSGTSATLVAMLWNQTTPRKTSWDPLRTPGKWNIQIQPMSVGLGGTLVSCSHRGRAVLTSRRMVQCLRLLLCHISLDFHLVSADATTGKDLVGQRNELGRHVCCPLSSGPSQY